MDVSARFSTSAMDHGWRTRGVQELSAFSWLMPGKPFHAGCGEASARPAWAAGRASPIHALEDILEKFV
jgi:hypothetical protein